MRSKVVYSNNSCVRRFYVQKSQFQIRRHRYRLHFTFMRLGGLLLALGNQPRTIV